MIPITAYPDTVNCHADHFRPCFSDKNFLHFKNYLTGLIIANEKNVSAINSQLAFAGDQSNLNRFLTDVVWDSEAVNNQRLNLLQENRYTEARRDGVISIDDTLNHKFGKKMEGAGWFYDHNGGKTIFGHNIVSSHYWGRNSTYPLHFEMYLKANAVSPEQFKTKIDIAIELVDKAEAANIPTETYAFDSWFCTKRLTDHIESYNKNWVSRVKSNRLVLHNGLKVRLTEFIKEYTKIEDYQPVTVKKNDLATTSHGAVGKGGDEITYYCYTKTVTLKSLGRVRIVVCYKNQKLEGVPVVLATNRLNWSQPKKVITTYGHRWPIETFYRDSKQSLGFSDYRFRDMHAVKKHICLVFLAYSLLELSRRQSSAVLDNVEHRLETIGQTAKRSCKQVFKELIFWVHQKFCENYEPEHIFQMLTN